MESRQRALAASSRRGDEDEDELVRRNHAWKARPAERSVCAEREADEEIFARSNKAFPTNTGMPPCSIARIDTVKPVRSSHVVIPRQPVIQRKIHPLRARFSPR